jgi:hypothetical protein
MIVLIFNSLFSFEPVKTINDDMVNIAKKAKPAQVNETIMINPTFILNNQSKLTF